jgi:hypothetical protein
MTSPSQVGGHGDAGGPLSCVFWLDRAKAKEFDTVTPSPETGFDPIYPQMNDHTDRGLGGRHYGASQESSIGYARRNQRGILADVPGRATSLRTQSWPLQVLVGRRD